MVHLKKKQKGDKNEIDLIYSVNLNTIYSVNLNMIPLSSLHTTTLQITKEGQSHEKQQQPPFSLAIHRGKISRTCRMACPSDGEDEMESAASDHS